MASTLQIKKALGLTSSKSRQAMNEAIKEVMPGGKEILNVLARLIEMQHGRAKPDPALADMMSNLFRARAAMVDVLKSNDSANVLIFALSQIHGRGSHTHETTAKSPSIHAPEVETKDPTYIELADETSPVPLSVLGTKPDTAIAADYGCSHTYVANLRRKNNIRPYSAKDRIDWAKWDKQITSSEMTAEGLASLIGCHASTIRERKRFLLGNGGKYSNLGAPLAADRIDWANADWSKSNQSLAQEYGVSDEAARKQRKKYQN